MLEFNPKDVYAFSPTIAHEYSWHLDSISEKGVSSSLISSLHDVNRSIAYSMTPREYTDYLASLEERINYDSNDSWATREGKLIGQSLAASWLNHARAATLIERLKFLISLMQEDCLDMFFQQKCAGNCKGCYYTRVYQYQELLKERNRPCPPN